MNKPLQKKKKKQPNLAGVSLDKRVLRNEKKKKTNYVLERWVSFLKK